MIISRCRMLAGLLVVLTGVAQEPLVIKSTTRLVQVSVIAKSHDQPADGLNVDDFKIFVDGKQQKISFFSAVSATDRPNSAPATPPAAQQTYTNVLAARGQAVNGVTVVLLDLVNTKLKDRIFAQQQLIKYLLSIPSTDRVAVYLFNGRLRVLHDYTSDMSEFQQQLAAANGKLVSVMNTADAGAIDSTSADFAFDTLDSSGGGAAARAFFLRNRVVGTLNVLKFIASNLAEVPGRKNLVWLSDGFPLTFGFERMSNFSEDFLDEMDATVRSLSDASIAVYPVDARGLTTPGQFDASRSGGAGMMGAGAPGKGGAPSKNPRPPRVSSQPQNSAHDTMEELAHRTGGKAYYNTNDLSKAIHEAVEDSALTYTLGFYPEDEKHNREFHKLKVEVAKPHINLSYRSGYLDLAAVPKDDKTRSLQVHDALWSPLDSTELSISVKLLPPTANALNVAVALDPKGIQIEPKDGRFAGRVDFLLVQFDHDGQPIALGTNTPMQTVDLNMLEPTYRKFLTQGLNVTQAVSLSPGASTLRVIVRDYGSGMIGSVTIPLKGSA